jgi:hypothetical protein
MTDNNEDVTKGAAVAAIIFITLVLLAAFLL